MRQPIDGSARWHTALQAASLECKPQRRWSKQRILEELRAWYRRPNINLRREDKGWPGQSIGTSAVCEGQGSGRSGTPGEEVVQAAGDRGDPRPICPCACRSRSAPWDEDRPLALAAKEYFGSWADALVAAGLLSEEKRPVPKRRWTPDDVLDAIHARRRQGLPITGVRYHATSLFYAALKHFGGWRKALAAAGLMRGDA